MFQITEKNQLTKNQQFDVIIDVSILDVVKGLR